MGLIYLAFYVICCIVVYSGSISRCLQNSFAGKVIWYYATISSCVIGVTLLGLLIVGTCASCMPDDEPKNLQVIDEEEYYTSESDVLVDGGEPSEKN